MSSKSKKRNAKTPHNVDNLPPSPQFTQMMGLFETVQEHEEQHQKCVNDALVVYKQMSHKDYMEIIWFGIRQWMGVESFDNTYSQTGLRFIARLAVSNHANDPRNKIVKSITDYLVERTSPKPVVRQFICYFIFYLVRYADILKVPLDIDSIVNHILTFFVHDRLSAVREQAVTVLLLFQDREDVIKALLAHLSTDQVAKVRRLIIKSIKFTDETVPHILERLQDTNELVRCDLYTDLIERDVRTLTIEQRCQILNSAHSDKSARVQAVIVDGLIPSWLRAYNNCYLKLLAAIKFDALQQDIQQFKRLSKYVLFILFEKFIEDGHIERLCEQLELKTEGEFINCMPFNRLSMEMLIFWCLLIQFGRNDNENQHSVDQIMCDVVTFCEYIQAFVSHVKNDNNTDDSTEDGFKFKIQILIEMLLDLDLDEFGKEALSDFVANLLINETEVLNETTISSLVKCAEKSVQNEILGQYFVDILHGIYAKVPSIDQKIDDLTQMVDNSEQKLRITQLKSQILDLKEDQDSSLNAENYKRLRQVQYEIKEIRIQIVDICRDFGKYDNEEDLDLSAYEMSTSEIIKCLQIFFYSCHSIRSDRAPTEMILFYGNFVYRYLFAEDLEIRGWALKSNASFSLRFDCAWNEALEACYGQFLLNINVTIWLISVTAICELLDKHQIEFKVPPISNINSDIRVNICDVLFDILLEMKHEEIRNALITGLCRLILSGTINDKKKIAFMLIEMFNPEAYASSHQILGQFMKQLTKYKCQNRLISALGTTFEIIPKIDAKFKLKDIIAFLNAIGIPELPHVTSVWHNQLAIELTKLMLQGYGSQLMNLFGDQLSTLKLHINDDFKQEIRPYLTELLGSLSGRPKQSVKEIWKKLGFKNSDRNFVQTSSTASASVSPSITRASTPSTSIVLSDQSLTEVSTERSTQSYSARESTNTTRTSLIRRTTSNRISSVSTRSSAIFNDENAVEPTNKMKQTQRADTGVTRKAFGNRANV